MTEFDLIDAFFTRFDQPATQPTIKKGIGDDAAVIKSSAQSDTVICTDTLVQGRHFFGKWSCVDALAAAIGYKAVAVNVSDLAAMGAKPHSILLALALPQRLANKAWLSRFSTGLHEACTEFGVALIGGDTTSCDKLVITVTAQGSIATDQAVYRSTAQVGDGVYVSGTLGDAGYALTQKDAIAHKLGPRLHKPKPRIELGQLLTQPMHRANAMIDVSDGLLQDLMHIATQSHVNMHINLEHLPTSTGLEKVPLSQRLSYQVSSGDDYELAFCLPAQACTTSLAQACKTPFTKIGHIIPTTDAAPSITLSYKGKQVTPDHPYPFDRYPKQAGYQHF